MNRRAFLAFIPAALVAPQRTVYRLSGYTATGAWATAIAGTDGLARAMAGLPVGDVHTWVAADRREGDSWVPLD